jgi:ribonuclease HII
MISPTLSRERALWEAGVRQVVGVDEVGVGPLCAAVVAAAVQLPSGIDPAELAGVRDSKTIANPRARERLAEHIYQVATRVVVGAASPREIDRLNVRGATALAMSRALKRLGAYDHALLDGRPLRGLDPERHTFLVDGDAHCLSIACASIVAKVTRDRLMCLLAARYPAYGWERNAGYATADHLAALRRHGPTPHHRQRYRPVLQAGLPLFELNAAPPVTPCQ